MRIVQANKAYYPHLGGVETVVRQLAEGFAAIPGVSSAVIACADERRTQRKIIGGASVTTTATLTRIAALAFSPSFAWHLLRNYADILHIHEPSLITAASYLAFAPLMRRRYRKLVVWWHSDIIRQRALSPFYTPMLKRLLREADAIVVSSPHLIETSAILKPFRAKCRVIHLGIEPSRFDDTPAMCKKVAEIQSRYTKPIVLFTGRLVYYKGVEYLARAMQNVPQAQLVIVGKGKLAPLIDELAKQAPGNIDIIPYLEDDDLAAFYKACSIFVLPSVEVTEAFGIVQLEAMANSKPVITSDLETGVTYVNQGGKTGLVVPRRDSDALADAINRLLGDKPLRATMGAYARERVLREFTVSRMIDQTMALYKELLDA